MDSDTRRLFGLISSFKLLSGRYDGLVRLVVADILFVSCIVGMQWLFMEIVPTEHEVGMMLGTLFLLLSLAYRFIQLIIFGLYMHYCFDVMHTKIVENESQTSLFSFLREFLWMMGMVYLVFAVLDLTIGSLRSELVEFVGAIFMSVSFVVFCVAYFVGGSFLYKGITARRVVSSIRSFFMRKKTYLLIGQSVLVGILLPFVIGNMGLLFVAIEYVAFVVMLLFYGAFLLIRFAFFASVFE